MRRKVQAVKKVRISVCITLKTFTGSKAKARSHQRLLFGYKIHSIFCRGSAERAFNVN